MKRVLLQFYNWIITYNDESRSLIRFLGKIEHKNELRILDVGCGYGRILGLLKENGFTATGVDINKKIVQANQKAGFDCLNVEGFEQKKGLYDVIIMFHVIEHFSPQDLLVFMESYLDRLKSGGYLIIATPLLTDYFYDDFDHIKPYSPTGIEMIFGGTNAQVQYYSKSRLKLLDICYKKYFYRLVNHRGLHMRVNSRYLILAFHFVSASLFKLSRGAIGKKDGWMGLYQKDVS